MPRGGKRPGAGRPKGTKKGAKPFNLCITEEQQMLLIKWGGGNASAGLRWLIDVGRAHIHEAEEEIVESRKEGSEP